MRSKVTIPLLSQALFALTSTMASANVELACGSSPGGGFYVETGVQNCDPKNLSDTAKGSEKILCLYNATCTPVVDELKKFVRKRLNNKTWDKITDDEINQTMIDGVAELTRSGGNLPWQAELHVVAVQCLGKKTQNGNPDCPLVNACVNQHTALWPLLPNPSTFGKSDGFRLEKGESGKIKPRTQKGAK